MNTIGAVPYYCNSQPAAAAASTDSLGQFLHIIHDFLRDVPGFEIQQSFAICNKWTLSRAIGVVDLDGIEEALKFLVSKLTNDQLINVWNRWAEKHHDRVLVEFLANEYFDRIVLCHADFESILDDFEECSPAIFGFISIAFQRNYMDDELFCDFLESNIDPILGQKIDEVLNLSHHLFAAEPLARLLSRIAFTVLLDDNDIDKALGILVTNCRIIFAPYEGFDVVLDLGETLQDCFIANILIPEKCLNDLKELFTVFEETVETYFEHVESKPSSRS